MLKQLEIGLKMKGCNEEITILDYHIAGAGHATLSQRMKGSVATAGTSGHPPQKQGVPNE